MEIETTGMGSDGDGGGGGGSCCWENNNNERGTVFGSTTIVSPPNKTTGVTEDLVSPSMMMMMTTTRKNEATTITTIGVVLTVFLVMMMMMLTPLLLKMRRRAWSIRKERLQLTPNKNNNKNKNQNNKYRTSSRNRTKMVEGMMVRRKKEFLRRLSSWHQEDGCCGCEYGYKDSQAGFIDDWRAVEFPQLIPPMKIDDDDEEEKVLPNSIVGYVTSTLLKWFSCFMVTSKDHTEMTMTTEKKKKKDEEQRLEPEIYLDYAGSGLPTQTQLQMMYSNKTFSAGIIYANPHSTGPAASRTLNEIQQVKQRVLELLNATPGRYAYLTGVAKKNNTTQYKTAVEQQPNVQNHHEEEVPSSSNNDQSSKNIAENIESLETIYTDPSQHHCGYDLVFTSGATEGFRLVAERFPWTKGRLTRRTTNIGRDHRCKESHHYTTSIFMYAVESHNSVTGMRHVAMNFNNKSNPTTKKNNNVIFHAIEMSELEKMTTDDFHSLQYRLLAGTEGGEVAAGDRSTRGGTDVCCSDSTHTHHCLYKTYNLLVFPAECNFSGHRLTDDSISSIISNARHGGWMTMLDIAKAASTGPVEMTTWDPDFASLSFYKLFGEPTGLGALLVKRSSINVLTCTGDNNESSPGENSNAQQMVSNYYQGGGSVNVMVPRQNYTVPKDGLASLTNGSVHFRGIIALNHGLDSLDRLGGMAKIHQHSTCLAREFVRRLKLLKHHGNATAFEIYGPWANDDGDIQLRAVGPTVAFNVLRDNGTYVGYNEVSKLGALYHFPIQFRTGCFCNPGACQKALRMSDKEVIDNFEKTGHKCGDDIDLVDGRPTGAVRVSFGKESIWEDLDVMIQFLEETFVDSSPLPYTSSPPPSVASTVTSSVEDEEHLSVEISELFIFPIKSCSAQRVRRWQVESTSGKLKYDREFALVDTSGSAMRLQKYPKLHSISPTVCLETKTMTVSAPGAEDLVLNLEDELYQGGESVVQVCGNKCGGKVWGSTDVSEWFSSVLGVQCWLARYSDINRSKNPNKDGPISSSSSRIRNGFSNEQPILLISEHAVSVLNQVLIEQNQDPVDSRRFRPNIVVKTSTTVNVGSSNERDSRSHPSSNQLGHIEDNWTMVSLLRSSSGLAYDSSPSSSSVQFKYSVEGGCPRCTMVDYDPATGSTKGKTLRALAKYRRQNGRIVFGIFLRLIHPSADERMETDIDDNNEDIINNDSNDAPSVLWISEGDMMECS